MQILLVGGGLTGSTLAARLAATGHDVVLVERDATVARRLTAGLDVQVVEGNGTKARILQEAGIERSDVVFATTESDEANMVVAMLAATMFRVPRLLVRLRDPDHEADFMRLARERGGDVQYRCINPDAAAVDRILSLLAVRGAIDVMRFMDGELLVAGFRIREGSDLAGLLVQHMSLLFANAPTLVVAIQRGPIWIVPHGDEELRAGDIAYFAIARSDLANVVSLVRGEAVAAREAARPRVIVAGATRIGLDLARRLESQDLQVTLLEEDAERAKYAAEKLGDTLVVHGLPTDQALLEEEGIERTSAFVAVTPDYEANLVVVSAGPTAGRRARLRAGRQPRPRAPDRRDLDRRDHQPAPAGGEPRARAHPGRRRALGRGAARRSHRGRRGRGGQGRAAGAHAAGRPRAAARRAGRGAAPQRAHRGAARQ